jgi:hypothetical protein
MQHLQLHVLPSATFAVMVTPVIARRKLRSCFDIVSRPVVLGALDGAVFWHRIARRICICH